jgi:hypothetical protein
MSPLIKIKIECSTTKLLQDGPEDRNRTCVSLFENSLATELTLYLIQSAGIEPATFLLGGTCRIRTCDRVTDDGFQDRCLKPTRPRFHVQAHSRGAGYERLLFHQPTYNPRLAHPKGLEPST